MIVIISLSLSLWLMVNGYMVQVMVMVTCMVMVRALQLPITTLIAGRGYVLASDERNPLLEPKTSSGSIPLRRSSEGCCTVTVTVEDPSLDPSPADTIATVGRIHEINCNGIFCIQLCSSERRTLRSMILTEDYLYAASSKMFGYMYEIFDVINGDSASHLCFSIMRMFFIVSNFSSFILSMYQSFKMFVSCSLFSSVCFSPLLYSYMSFLNVFTY